MAETIQITVKADLPPFLRDLARLRQDQIPFALSRALNLTAADAQRAARGELAKRFTLRNAYSERGIQIEPSKKAQWPRLRALVGIEERRSYLVDHVTGAVRRPKKAPMRAIPTRFSRSRRTTTGKIKKEHRPYRLVRERKAVVSAQGDLVLATGKRKLLKHLKVLYLLRPQVRIRKAFPFEAEVRDTAQRRIGYHFKRTFVAALRDAR